MSVEHYLEVYQWSILDIPRKIQYDEWLNSKLHYQLEYPYVMLYDPL